MTVREIVETLGLAADEDAVRRMAEYNAMVIAMSRKMNLTGIKDAEESLVKNIYDSLTVYEEKYFPKNGRMLDLGTGAGFPGIPLAILRPDMQIVLVDSVLKKLGQLKASCIMKSCCLLCFWLLSIIIPLEIEYFSGNNFFK